MIGETFGNYRLVAELGSGGMGAVWLAEHTMLGSKVAIKVLRPELSQNQGIVQRFFDEARAASRVNHPNIVSVVDFGWQQSTAYLVMEHLQGQTVTRAIYQTGRVAPERALFIVREAAVAMAAAHAVQIIHRDLKPDNIFLVPDLSGGERVKVLDFGIAKLLGDSEPGHNLTQTGMIMGTPAYMSPEQCRGAGRVDHRTDIYALGCVLFHLLTGRTPFVAATPGDLIASHLTVPPPAPSSVTTGISPELDALVLRCLAKELDQRISTMPELIEAIDALLAAPSQLHATIALPPPVAPVPVPVPAVGTTMASSAGEVQRGAPAWRGGLIIGAFAVLGGVIAVIAMLSTGGGSEPAKAPVDAAIVTPAVPPDAALAPVVDAAAAAAAVDAGTPTKVPVKKPPRLPRTGSGGGSGSDGGSQSGGGSGSAYMYEGR
ncbi:MAG: protein kinase [Myxococcales bacterium]|nr:protein kinase [Myxococcales bacterium]